MLANSKNIVITGGTFVEVAQGQGKLSGTVQESLQEIIDDDPHT